MIGVLGALRFRTSDRRIFTFRNFKREVSGSWNTTERIGKKPMTEFGGAKLQTVTFDIQLDAGLGVKPRGMLEKIEHMVEKGEVNFLIIGREQIGTNNWVITKSSETWNTVLSGGELLRASVTLTLQEYV